MSTSTRPPPKPSKRKSNPTPSLTAPTITHKSAATISRALDSDVSSDEDEGGEVNGKEDELASDGGDSDDLDGEVVAPVVSKKGKGKGKEKAAAPIPPPPAPYTSSISESSSGDDDDDEDELDSDNVDAMDVDPVQASKPVKKKRDPRTGALIYAPYQPPPNFRPLPLPTPSSSSSTTVSTNGDINVNVKVAQAFEWNELAKKGGVELWCIRVPASFKPSRLQNLSLTPSALSGPSPSPSHPLGTLTTAKNTYHLLPTLTTPSSSSHLPNTTDPSAPHPALVDSLLPTKDIGRGARAAGEGERDGEREEVVKAEMGVGLEGEGNVGEEMRGLRLVVVDERRGGMYLAPKQPSRHLILKPLPTSTSSTTTIDITSQLPDPTSSANVDLPLETTAAVAKTKRKQPEGLKYRNVPFGAVGQTVAGLVATGSGAGSGLGEKGVKSKRKSRVVEAEAGEDTSAMDVDVDILAPASSQPISTQATATQESDATIKKKKNKKSLGGVVAEDGAVVGTPEKGEKKRKAKSGEEGEGERDGGKKVKRVKV